MTTAVFTARCTCGRIIDVGSSAKSLWEILEILHPEIKDESDRSDERLVAILGSRHELAKGKRHKVTLHVTIEFDDPPPSTGSGKDTQE